MKLARPVVSEVKTIAIIMIKIIIRILRSRFDFFLGACTFACFFANFNPPSIPFPICILSLKTGLDKSKIKINNLFQNGGPEYE